MFMKLGSALPDYFFHAEYETENYRVEPCLVRYTDCQKPARDLGYTFKFAGDLSEGSFELRVWLKRMGRQAGVEKLDAKTVGDCF